MEDNNSTSEDYLSNVYDNCKLIVETYCETRILQTFIEKERSEEICRTAREILQEIEDFHNEF